MSKLKPSAPTWTQAEQARVQGQGLVTGQYLEKPAFLQGQPPPLPELISIAKIIVFNNCVNPSNAKNSH